MIKSYLKKPKIANNTLLFPHFQYLCHPQVIRTFGAIGLADKRIIRSLQEKEKLEAMFAK